MQHRSAATASSDFQWDINVDLLTSLNFHLLMSKVMHRRACPIRRIGYIFSKNGHWKQYKSWKRVSFSEALRNASDDMVYSRNNHLRTLKLEHFKSVRRSNIEQCGKFWIRWQRCYEHLPTNLKCYKRQSVIHPIEITFF